LSLTSRDTAMNQSGGSTERRPRMIAAVRTFHTLIALVCIGSIAVVYHSGITGTLNVWFYLATALVVFEGIAIVLNKGECPFLHIHRRYGDEKRLIELVLPKRFAKLVVPFYAVLIAIGYALVLIDLD